MPDPDFNPNAKVMAIDAIQAACILAGARLIFLPEGPNAEDTPAQFALSNGKELKLPLKHLLTDKDRDTAIAGLVERLEKAVK